MKNGKRRRLITVRLFPFDVRNERNVEHSFINSFFIGLKEVRTFMNQIIAVHFRESVV